MANDQFSAIEMLLGDSSELDDPVKRKATAAALRRQNAMGVVGQLMGVQPTQMAGTSMIDNSQQSLKLAMAQRQAEKEAKSAASRQDIEDKRWWAKYDQDAAQNDALNNYRTQSLANKGAEKAITPYQQALLDDKEATRAASAERTKEAARAKRLASLATNINASGAAELNQAVHDANASIGKYGTGNIPGVGGMSNVPVIGRFSGGEEGRQVRARIAAVRNALLKARSGGAVTESEAARMEEELGTMLGSTDETLRQTWPAFVDRYNATLGAMIGQNADLVDEYRKSNPRFKGFVEKAQPPAAPKAPTGTAAAPVAVYSREDLQ